MSKFQVKKLCESEIQIKILTKAIKDPEFPFWVLSDSQSDSMVFCTDVLVRFGIITDSTPLSFNSLALT